MTNAILEAWSETFRRRSEHPALLAPDGSTLRTFAGIEEESAQLAQLFFTEPAWLPGLVLAIQVGNVPMLLALLLAAWRAGAVPVLFDRSLEGPALVSALETCEAGALISTGPKLERRATGRAFADGTQFLKFTSGTTGAARAIRFTSAQLLADCEAVCETMGIGEGDLNYGAIPWSHSYGFSNLVTPLLCRGVPMVVTEDRLPRAILDGLTRSGATVFPGLPVFYQKLAELDAPAPPSLRLCISAGAPLAAAVAAAFRTRFGRKVHSFYGSSECGGIAYDASEDDAPEGLVGRPMRGVAIDFAHGDEAGRIMVRSAAVGEGYFPEPEPEVLGGGRFSPGDLVQRTERGLVLAGRVSDFINVAGRKVNPAAVEAVLRACPGVAEAVVFGVPHPHRGEEPVACVAGTATAEALGVHCANNLPAWQVPRDFWRVDTLPVNERGKLNRRALAEAYQQRERRVAG